MVFGRKLKKLVTAHIVDDHIYLAVAKRGETDNYQVKYLTWLSLNDPALRELIVTNKLKRYPVYLVLGGKQIVIRVINIPELPPNEIRQALSWEITKYIPIPREELIFDFEVLDRVNTQSGRQLRIMVIAARKQYIEGYCDILAHMGLKPMVVDIEGTVLKYLYLNFKKSKANANACCIYLDEHRGVFSFISNNNLFFVHNVEWEGELIITRLSSEYQRVTNYLERQLQMPHPTEIYLLGPQANTTLQEDLRAQLGVDVNQVNFAQDPYYTFVVGLTLREVE